MGGFISKKEKTILMLREKERWCQFELNQGRLFRGKVNANRLLSRTTREAKVMRRMSGCEEFIYSLAPFRLHL